MEKEDRNIPSLPPNSLSLLPLRKAQHWQQLVHETFAQEWLACDKWPRLVPLSDAFVLQAIITISWIFMDT